MREISYSAGFSAAIAFCRSLGRNEMAITVHIATIDKVIRSVGKPAALTDGPIAATTS